MIFKDRRYAIFNQSELSIIDFSEVLEDGNQSLRYSVNDEKTFVKWDGQTPSFIQNLQTLEGPYQHYEMLIILKSPEWHSSI